MDLVFSRYEQVLMNSRERFKTESAFHYIFNAAIAPEVLELFWIYYCSIGVGMTEPVEGWIRRAGERCVAMNWTELGVDLIADAQQEAGHHLLMVADVKSLIRRWNQRHPEQLQVSHFLNQSYPQSVQVYADLHEAVIAGNAPFGQIAIEYEIECLAVQYGAELIAFSQAILGDDFRQSLSFIQTHVTLDASHSETSKIKLQHFLEENPDCLEVLATVGSGALDSYRAFLQDCLTAAQRHYQSLSAQVLAPV